MTNIKADALSRIVWDRELTSEAVLVILDRTMEGCSPLQRSALTPQQWVPAS